MEPTYHDMQIVLIDKHMKEYKSGDVIAFYCEGLSSVLVKRIVAGPGKSVQIINGILYVDDISVKRYERCLFEYSGKLAEKVWLDRDQYIVIGDNIKESRDSRDEDIGIINAGDILGVVR